MSTEAHPTRASGADRVAFVDVLRGLAVWAMLWMHTADGWLQPSYRGTRVWSWVTAVGGMAAPAFFTLAGVGLGLAWRSNGPSRDPSNDAGRQQPQLTRQLIRGVQLILVGYGLRVWLWMIDAGGAKHVTGWLAAICFTAAYVLAYRQLKALACRQRQQIGHWGIAVAMLAGGAALVVRFAPHRITGLVRVDVLQGLGASIVVVSAACMLAPVLTRRVGYLAVLGVAVACATPLVRQWMPGALPVPVAGYFAAWTLGPGEPNPTLFPLFPWLAYVWFGAAFGVSWQRIATQAQAQRVVWVLCAAGVLAAALVSETRPWVHAWLHEHPSATQPARVLYRCAVLAAVAGPTWWLTDTRVGGVLQALGTASLWVYCVHLEFAFGALAGPIRRQLGVTAWLAGLAVLTWLMFMLSKLVRAKRARPEPREVAASRP